VDFYTGVLALDLVSRREDDSQAVFQIGDALLVLFCRPEYERVGSDCKSGTDHTAFCLDDTTYDEVLARLREADLVEREPTMNKGAFGDGLATYFSDPDGNALEIKKYSEMQPWNSDVPSDADVIPITSRG
jgi:catechol-2,3-dioxygenase